MSIPEKYRKWFIPLALAVAVGAGYALAALQHHKPKKIRAETTILPQPTTPATLKSYASTPPPSPPDPASVREMPEAERAKLQGEGGLDSASYFYCELTNSSQWMVTELRFHIAAGQPEGSTRWERNYRELVQLMPHSVKRISFKVTHGLDAETRWEIIGARGIPPR